MLTYYLNLALLIPESCLYKSVNVFIWLTKKSKQFKQSTTPHFFFLPLDSWDINQQHLKIVATREQDEAPLHPPTQNTCIKKVKCKWRTSHWDLS